MKTKKIVAFLFPIAFWMSADYFSLPRMSWVGSTSSHILCTVRVTQCQAEYSSWISLRKGSRHKTNENDDSSGPYLDENGKVHAVN